MTATWPAVSSGSRRGNFQSCKLASQSASAEGERLARAASGPTELVVFEEGNHVCFNISYKLRPLTADWMVEHLGPASN